MTKRILLIGLLTLTLATLNVFALTGCGGSTENGIQPIIGNTSPDGDYDGDGTVNAEDEDDDNDGFADGEDCNPFDVNVSPGANDEPDGEYSDSNCDGMDGDIDGAIWVSTSEGDDTFIGSITKPVKTITQGLTLASAGTTKDVYIVEGSYPEDVTLTGNISIYGGFGLLTPEDSRDREIESHETEIVGMDNDKKATITFHKSGGGEMDVVIDYTFFITNSNSSIGGITLVGDIVGPVGIILNSNATISNCNIVESEPPPAGRAFSLALGLMVDRNTTDDHTVSITDNKIVMKGTNDIDEADYGIMAIPAIEADKALTINVERNEITASGTSERSIAISAVDDDQNPINSIGDKNADFNLFVHNNKINITGTHEGAVGILGGAFYIAKTIPEDNDLFYIKSFEATDNIIELQSTDSMQLGINVGGTRVDPLVANNVISIKGMNDNPGIGIISMQSHSNILNNTINISETSEFNMGIFVMGATDPSILPNYRNNINPNRITNNLINIMPIEPCNQAFGISEFENEPNIVNPAEIKNNNFFVNPNCTLSALYAEPSNAVMITSITDLNNKTGFTAGDTTIFADNISADPLFVDVASNNLSLEDTSPCIDTGLDLGEDWADILGISRPQGEGFDIGAYEK